MNVRFVRKQWGWAAVVALAVVFIVLVTHSGKSPPAHTAAVYPNHHPVSTKHSRPKSPKPAPKKAVPRHKVPKPAKPKPKPRVIYRSVPVVHTVTVIHTVTAPAPPAATTTTQLAPDPAPPPVSHPKPKPAKPKPKPKGPALGYVVVLVSLPSGCRGHVSVRIFHSKIGYAVRSIRSCSQVRVRGVRLGDNICQVIRPPLRLAPLSSVCQRVSAFGKSMVFAQVLSG